MAGYYFIKSNGHLFRLTKKAYHSWIISSANRINQNKPRAKLRNYGLDLGDVALIKSNNDFDSTDFTRLNKLYLDDHLRDASWEDIDLQSIRQDVI